MSSLSIRYRKEESDVLLYLTHVGKGCLGPKGFMITLPASPVKHHADHVFTNLFDLPYTYLPLLVRFKNYTSRQSSSI